MSNFRPALGALAVFLLLVLVTDSEAGWRCRQARCCSTCYATDGCAIPSCVPWVARCGYAGITCDPGYTCWCCSGGKFVTCISVSSCDGSVCCVLDCSGIQLSCGYGGGGSACQRPTTYAASSIKFAFVGDDTKMKLRPAKDGEKPEVLSNEDLNGRDYTRKKK